MTVVFKSSSPVQGTSFSRVKEFFIIVEIEVDTGFWSEEEEQDSSLLFTPPVVVDGSFVVVEKGFTRL